RGLAYPRLTAHHQHPAAARPHRVNQLIQHAAFTAPVREPARASPPRGSSPDPARVPAILIVASKSGSCTRKNRCWPA
ncbi:MAG: hypothetical protein WAL72_31760, partial [Streptosporangiaceae bacterium]